MADNFTAGWGVYVHVPYCVRRCPYCAFNVHVRRNPDWSALARALAAELAVRRAAMPAGPALSLYFGGGTPALAPAAFIAEVVARVGRACGLRPASEITLEANPGGVTPHQLRAFADAGINRLSLGWQSSRPAVLRRLGRDHGPADNRAAVAAARAAGISNVSVDLIFAVPGQSLADLDADLDEVEAARPQHVSTYAMTYHPDTPFARWRLEGRLRAAPEGRELAMMSRIQRRLGAGGWERYEISNFARRGEQGRHNGLIWRGGQLLGLGPGAHSFAHQSWRRGWRWANLYAPDAYVARWQRRPSPRPGRPPRAGAAGLALWERLTPAQLVLERMMCGLRLAEGVRLDADGLAPFAEALAEPVAQACRRGWARRRGARLLPTAAGLRHADLLAGLFVLE